MRKSALRKALISAVAGLALAACATPASATALTTQSTKAAHPKTVTYAFYTTDNGVPAQSDVAPMGWLYQDNTDFEDDYRPNPSNATLGCEVTYLSHVDTYVCTVPAYLAPVAESPAQSEIITYTDDGDMVYVATQTVLDPVNGGQPTNPSNTGERTPVYS